MCICVDSLNYRSSSTDYLMQSKHCSYPFLMFFRRLVLVTQLFTDQKRTSLVVFIGSKTLSMSVLKNKNHHSLRAIIGIVEVSNPRRRDVFYMIAPDDPLEQLQIEIRSTFKELNVQSLLQAPEVTSTMIDFCWLERRYAR